MMNIENKLILPERLQLRDTARLQGIEERKQGKQTGYSLAEEIRYFDCTFGAMKSSFLKKLETTESASKENLNSIFDELTTDLQKMQKFLGDSTMFLPSYDIKISQETIKTLEEFLKEKEDGLQPKKKFGFKGKKKRINELKGKIKDSFMPKDPGITVISPGLLRTNSFGCGLANKVNEKLCMYEGDISSKDVALSNLKGCDVRLYGAPNTVHITNLSDCTVLVGPVQTSVFIQDCKQSVFTIACQQLRAHNVSDSDCYIHVTSRAIIEDCRGLRFAPYTWRYTDLDRHYEMSGLDRCINNWDSIDDFNWLALNTPSPNWTILPTNERKLF